jgi:hypothetical protein
VDRKGAYGVTDRDKLREAMDAIIEGREPPDGVLFHATKTTTQADWDALDPNSYETECAKCGAYIVGRFGPNNEANTPCPDCGSTEYTGGIGSPAGAFSLAMHDPAFD